MMVDKLRYKELDNIDIDSDALITFHRNVLLNKKIIGNVFKEFYTECYNLSKKYSLTNDKDGAKIEIGSGSSLFKHYFPDITSTDIKTHKHNDMSLDAQNMINIDNNSIETFYAINCFHHFPNPKLFFNELNRTLKSGGTCIVVEPYFGMLSSFLYKRMFETESFDKNQKDWNYISNGPMMGANQALSYIVFFRDLEIFLSKNPNLEIVHTTILNNYLRYLFSGGLNFKQLVPSWLEKPIKFIEFILKPIRKLFALHHIIVIRKK
jgi:SAM-dependent methyltransferase